MAVTDIGIAELPSLGQGSVQGDDILPIVDVHDLTDPTGTTKGVTLDASTYRFIPGTSRTVADFKTYIANNATFNVKDFGAVGDGTTDDTAALNACYAAATPGNAVMYIPPGNFRFTSQLLWNRHVNVIGSGIGSVLKPDLSSTSIDAIAVTPPTSQFETGLIIGNFAIVSNVASPCKNGIVFTNYMHGQVPNLHVRCAAAQYGMVISGCISSRFEFITSGTIQYPYPSTYPLNGLLINATTSYPCNNNEYYVKISGCAGNGVYIDAETAGGGVGDSVLSGLIESLSHSPTGYGLYATQCSMFHLHDLHVETNQGNVTLNQCSLCKISKVFIPGSGTAGNLTLTGCTQISIDTVELDSLTLDASCSDIEVRNFNYSQNGGALTDPANALKQLGTWTRDGAGTANIQQAGSILVDPTNMLDNGNFERWPGGGSAIPDNWTNAGSSITWTKTGTGLGDTTRNFTRYAALASSCTTSNYPGFTVDFLATEDEWVTAWCWIYVPAANPAVTIQALLNASTFNGMSTTATAVWQKLVMTLKAPSATYSNLRIFFKPASNGQFYLANAGYCSGRGAPVRLIRNYDTVETQRVLNGLAETTATAMPSTGTYFQGDFVWNSTPTILGATGAKYTLRGWERITTGSAHVLNTDWAEVRAPAGDISSVPGALTVTTGFGCNGTTPQTAVSGGAALATYGAGANGFDTAGHAQEIHDKLNTVLTALRANGILTT